MNNFLNLDDLIRSYLRFKEWMDYDAERSAYSAKEIIVMQKLFGTAYITVPVDLVAASYDELLSVMDKRQIALTALTEAIDGDADESEIEYLRMEVDKTTFKSTVHHFITLHQAIWQAVESAKLEVESGQEQWTQDTEPFDDHFEEVNETMFEDIRAFVASEHPKIELMRFSAEMAYDLGLPRRAPEPINYQFH